VRKGSDDDADDVGWGENQRVWNRFNYHALWRRKRSRFILVPLFEFYLLGVKWISFVIPVRTIKRLKPGGLTS